MIIVGQNRRIAHELLTQSLSNSLHKQLLTEEPKIAIGKLELSMLVYDVCDIAAQDLFEIPIDNDAASKLRAFTITAVPDRHERKRLWNAIQIWASSRMRTIEDLAGIGSIRE